MTLNSALEDLRGTTLRAISGGLRALEYLSRLRNQAGAYAHWGLARVYGEMSARKALVQAHRSLVAQVLSTPLRKLKEDAEFSSELAGMPAARYIERLRELPLLPPEPGAGSARHLNSVLHALLILAQSRTPDAIRPAS